MLGIAEVRGRQCLFGHHKAREPRGSWLILGRAKDCTPLGCGKKWPHEEAGPGDQGSRSKVRRCIEWHEAGWVVMGAR